MTQSATETKTGTTTATPTMTPPNLKVVYITAGTHVQIGGTPLTLTQDTPVSGTPENVAMINRDLLVPHGQSER